MNLHNLVVGAISAVNPQVWLQVWVSIGSVTNPDGIRVPAYAAPRKVLGQVQPVSYKDIEQLDGLNLNGTRKSIYINGHVDGLVRVDKKGGDLISLPNGDLYLVAMIAEGWDTAGWTRCLCALQDQPGYSV